MPVSAKATPRRTAAKGVRRQQLIEATIDSIAKRGLSDTTLSHIANTAGLSTGIVNLHFTSKEILLTETLKHLRDEYEQAWQSALAKSNEDPASQLACLLRADYQPGVANVKKLAVWFAFWGEAKSRPTYQKICQDRVSMYTKALDKILDRLLKHEDSSINKTDLAEGIMAMADGLWLNMLISARKPKRADAERIMMHYLAQTFPKHRDAFL